MSKCYLCKTPLTTKNRTDEHILLNSIGGRLKSNKLICKECNSTFGHKIDSVLANQLLPFSNLLRIKRERGKTPPLKNLKTKSGKNYNLNDGKPTMSHPEVIKKEDGYSIKARNEKELIGILENIKRKHPKLDIEKAREHFQHNEYRLKEPIEINITIGGNDALRAICKIAVNFLLLTGCDREYVVHLIPYLKCECIHDAVFHFYPSEPIYTLCEGEVTHTIYLKGDNVEKVLFAYIEFFSCYSFIVILNDRYNGEEFEKEYIFDVLQMKELKKTITLQVGRDQLLGLKESQNNYFSTIQNKLKRVVNIWAKRDEDESFKELFLQTWDDSIGTPDGTVITNEKLEKFINLLSERMVKFKYDTDSKHN